MSNRYDSQNNRDRNGLETDRYGAFRDESGVVVYETDNDDAWLRSDTAVEIDEMV